MKEVVELLIDKKETISFMESCTGGFLSNEITNVENSSLVFKFGAVTYSNEYKEKMGVDKNIIDKYSVYSMETAVAMSKSISNYTDSDYGVGVTGHLLKSDPFNKSDNNDIVYYSIYNRKRDEVITGSIKVYKETRIQNKELVSSEIIKKIIEIIK